IVLIGIVLGVGLFVLSTLRTSIATDYDGSQDLINASAGTTTLTDSALTNFNLSSVDSVINQTSTAFTNYTFTGAGVITWGNNIVAANETDLLNVTYTYTYDATSSPEGAITTTISGLATFADWIAIIVVVIAAAIVLGVVLSSFGGKRNRI
ncbi:unnamed protein product, partial [marine sediment metagenome]